MLLLEEFFRQGDLERELGLPFSPLCDRNNTLVAVSQIGFIEFIVEPSMNVCADMLEIILAPVAPLICNNNTSNSNKNSNTLSIPNDTNAEAINNVDVNSAASSAPSSAGSATGAANKNGNTSETNNNNNNEKPNRLRIKKPWIACLAENKRIWKEQAIKGECFKLSGGLFSK
jgi:hypothetical protein